MERGSRVPVVVLQPDAVIDATSAHTHPHRVIPRDGVGRTVQITEVGAEHGR